jgi:hypothetical protein
VSRFDHVDHPLLDREALYHLVELSGAAEQPVGWAHEAPWHASVYEVHERDRSLDLRRGYYVVVFYLGSSAEGWGPLERSVALDLAGEIEDELHYRNQEELKKEGRW